MPCFYKKYLGIACPGCGMQTAFIELLKGHLWKSILAYPALIPIIFLLSYLVLHLINDYRNGARNLKIIFIFTTSIIVINYIIKLII